MKTLRGLAWEIRELQNQNKASNSHTGQEMNGKRFTNQNPARGFKREAKMKLIPNREGLVPSSPPSNSPRNSLFLHQNNSRFVSRHLLSCDRCAARWGGRGRSCSTTSRLQIEWMLLIKINKKMPIYKLWSKPVNIAAQFSPHVSWSRSLGRGEETFQFVFNLCFQSYFVENFIPLW